MGAFRPIAEHLALSAGSQSANAGTVVFADSGGVSFGLSGSSQMTASVGAGATATGNFGGIAAGPNLVSSGTVLFSSGHNVVFGLAGSVLTASASYSSPVASTAIQSVGTANAAGTNTSRFAADDHVHRGVRELVTAGGASLFGAVELEAGNLMALSTAGADSKGTLQIINLLSSTALATPVSSVTAAGTLTNRYARADHAHAGVNSVAVAGSNTAGAFTSGAGSLVLAGGPSLRLSGATAPGGMTVSVGGGALSYFSRPELPERLGFFNASLFLQRQHFPLEIAATQCMHLLSMTAPSSAGTLNMSLAVYTLSQSVASLASSGAGAVTWPSNGTAAVSGVQWRSYSFPEMKITPGDYLVGILMRSLGAGAWSVYGLSGPAVSGTIATTVLGNGHLNATVTTLPSFLNVTQSSYLRSGPSVNLQPGFVLRGTGAQ